MLSSQRLTGIAGDHPTPTLTVRNIDQDLVRGLRTRAAAHGRSAEAEHREIPARPCSERTNGQPHRRQPGASPIFRRRTAGRGPPSATDLLAQSRAERMQTLTGPDNAA